MGHLALDDVVRSVLLLGRGSRIAQGRNRVEDRRQWVAQLVCQQREKFVLAAVCIPQRCLALPERVLEPDPLDEIARLAAIDLQAPHLCLGGPMRIRKMHGDRAELRSIGPEQRNGYDRPVACGACHLVEGRVRFVRKDVFDDDRPAVR